MYIPEFWVGFIVGFVAATVLIVVLAVWCSKKDRGKRK